MKSLSQLTDNDFIKIAKIIDNNFIGNAKITVYPINIGVVRVVGHTEGKQCINCDVKIDVFMNRLKGVFIYNNDPEIEGAYRHVHPPTLKRVIDYLKANEFNVFGE